MMALREVSNAELKTLWRVEAECKGDVTVIAHCKTEAAARDAQIAHLQSLVQDGWTLSGTGGKNGKWSATRTRGLLFRRTERIRMSVIAPSARWN